MIINGVTVHESVLPAAVSWRWTSEDGGEYSITWLRWTSQMIFGVRVKGNEAWSSTRMAQRWDNTEKTVDGARAVVREFLAARREDQ